MALSVVILAAGQGTRMKSDTPKVLHEISGKPMLFHTLDAARAVSDDITVVLYHQAEKIQQEIESAYKNIHFHIQDAENFPGTGGAMRGVTAQHDRILILNGDMPLLTEASLQLLAEGDAEINMSIIHPERPYAYGRVVIEKGRVQKIIEDKDCTPEQKQIRHLNAGVYCISRHVLEAYIPRLSNHNAQAEYYLTDIVQMAVEDHREVHPVIVEEKEFQGVNSKLDLANAERFMQDRIKAALMLQGITMRLPETIYIDSRASFEGECMLENGVTILGESRLVRAHIKAHSVIESSHIEDSTVGPMGRVRPDTLLTKSHIGNFVEVKKSTLTGVKAGHLSYIGDSTVGEGSNIGAGVITCNYDGRSKYQTVIGKNVFIGSDTQLIAPVTIEDEVMIAAGSTVNKNIEKGSLAISRAPLKTVKNFFYKFFGKEA